MDSSGQVPSLREDLEAHSRVDPSLTQGLGAELNATEAAKALARRVCLPRSNKTAFSRVTVLLRDAEGRFVVLGSVGVDDLALNALDQWGELMVAEERRVAGVVMAALNRIGVRSLCCNTGRTQCGDGDCRAKTS